jgi:hypothetical protein
MSILRVTTRRLDLKSLVTVSFLGLLFASAAEAATGEQVTRYLCVMDKATGFSYDKSGSWQSTDFKVEEKYLVTPRPKNFSDELIPSDVAWLVTAVGEKRPKYFCKEDFNKIGYLSCKGLFSEFKMSRATMRFQSYYGNGYVSDEKMDTPYVAIGKCSKI